MAKKRKVIEGTLTKMEDDDYLLRFPSKEVSYVFCEDEFEKICSPLCKRMRSESRRDIKLTQLKNGIKLEVVSKKRK